MTDKQLEIFETHKHIISEKIAELAPEFIGDEDFYQDAYVILIEYIIKKSDMFENIRPCNVALYIRHTLTTFINKRCKSLKIEKAYICSYNEVASVEDPNNSFSAVDTAIANYCIAQAMSSLTPREQLVIAMRFGFLNRRLSLDETGDVLGLTRERIRQIECKALRKLRHPSRSKIMQNLYNG